MNINTNFEMTEIERQHNCLKTIINILISRNWLDDKFNEYYNKLISTRDSIHSGDLIDSTNITCLGGKKIAIKFYGLKLNTLKNEKEIDNFITKYPEHHKILIVNEISPKAEKQIMESNGFEVFRVMEIIRDISTHHLVPKHILLDNVDSQRVMEEYKLKKKDMGRIYIDDKMARYLYAQKDDIIQIIRYSINSGYSTYYRLVVPGSVYT